jgi:uncharacterized membrane protein YphA (DoxX/SURF4 family)
MKASEFGGGPDRAGQWAIRVIVAVLFTIIGIEKFETNPASYWSQTFDAIGMGQWFRYFTGVWEVIGGLLFLVPAATVIGFAMLACAMVGAAGAQTFVLHHPGYSLFPGAYLMGVTFAFGVLRAARRGKV